MRAHEEWIVVKSLSPWRFIIGVVQAHHSIPEKGCELATSVFQLRGRGRCLDYLSQIGPHLQVSVLVVINSRSPFSSLSISKDGTRHLKFTQLPGLRDQIFAVLFASRQLFETIP